MKVKIILSLMLLGHCMCAQQADGWQQLKDKYPDEPAVFMERSESVTIQVKNDSLVIYSDVFEDILYLKEQADVYANRRVHGSHFSQVGDIKAKTLVWDKSKHKEMSVSDFSKKFDTGDGVFYDDSYYYSFSFPSVAPRNRTQLEYRTNFKDARFIPGFVFTSYIPQERAIFTLKTSPDIELAHDIVNDTEKKIKFRKYAKGKDVFYEWTGENLSAYKYEESSPSIRYYAPHVICYVKSWGTGSGKKNVLSGLDDLYAWYSTFIKGLDAKPSEDLISVVNTLKSGASSEEEIVKRIFYWVQDNIRYIAFEEGMRGLIPHTGSYVCEKRYGDCKDMASIIVAMLRVAGIKGYHTWIGTRDLPYQYSKVPTPLVDNHMIATYISKDNKYYFLDATSNHTPFGYPSSMIQGKEALIGKGAGEYEVKIVPEIPKEENLVNDSVSIQISEGQVMGKGQASLTGYSKVFAGYRLDRSQKEATERNVVQLLNKGSNKFYLDNFTILNLEDKDKPTKIDYAFRIGDYFQKIGNELYINLNLSKDHYNEYINEATRKTPWENEYKYMKNEVVTLQIPEGYAVDYIPESLSYKGANMGADIEYAVNDETITLTKKFYIDFLMLPVAEVKNWNESVKKLSDAYKESIILKKK